MVGMCHWLDVGHLTGVFGNGWVIPLVQWDNPIVPKQFSGMSQGSLGHVSTSHIGPMGHPCTHIVVLWEVPNYLRTSGDIPIGPMG